MPESKSRHLSQLVNKPWYTDKLKDGGCSLAGLFPNPFFSLFSLSGILSLITGFPPGGSSSFFLIGKIERRMIANPRRNHPPRCSPLMECAQIIRIWGCSRRPGSRRTMGGASKKGYYFTYYYSRNMYVHTCDIYQRVRVGQSWGRNLCYGAAEFAIRKRRRESKTF